MQLSMLFEKKNSIYSKSHNRWQQQSICCLFTFQEKIKTYHSMIGEKIWIFSCHYYQFIDCIQFMMILNEPQKWYYILECIL